MTYGDTLAMYTCQRIFKEWKGKFLIDLTKIRMVQ